MSERERKRKRKGERDTHTHAHAHAHAHAHTHEFQRVEKLVERVRDILKIPTTLYNLPNSWKIDIQTDISTKTVTCHF